MECCFRCLMAAIFLGLCLGQTQKLFGKYAPTSLDPRRVDSFFALPQTRSVAESNGWALAEDRIESDGYAILCRKKDYRVCLLFDAQESVAGVQIGFSEEDADKSATPYTLDSVPFQEKKNMFDTDIYAATILFVDDGTLKSGGRILTDDTKIAPNGMYYVLRDGNRRHVPGSVKDLEGTLYRKQSCKQSMGRHYYYNSTENLDCFYFETFAPVYDEWTGELTATAYFVFGQSSFEPHGRHWFEEATGTGLKLVFPDSPDCLKEWADTYGFVVFHIYVHSEPWAIRCPEEAESKRILD